MENQIIGIDLGTTFSIVSVYEAGRSQVLRNELGEALTPSIVALSKDGTTLVGTPAKERLLANPKSGVACFKRDMGTDAMYSLSGKSWSPVECSAVVLRELKRMAEQALGTTIGSAVISVPAYFRDTQRLATLKAAEFAGLKVERLINEPTAAALAYGYQRPEEETNILVFDLGGGTFDVTILEIFDGVIEVKASAGESHLGGEDYTDQLSEHLVSKHEIKVATEDSAKWRKAVNTAKCCLSRGDTTTFDFLGQSVSVTREDLDAASAELNTRIRGVLKKCIYDSGMPASEIDQVLCVGGASRMGIVKEIIESIFPGKVNLSVDPDEAIAIGAGVQAALIELNEGVEDIVLTDVSPHTMGVMVSKKRGGVITKGFFSPIIDRNTTLPVSKSEVYSTFHHEQDEIDLKVYQGESRFTKDNHFVGNLKLNGLSHDPNEEQNGGAVEVRFTYDMNGLLEVEATIISTQRKITKVFEQRPGMMDKNDIKAALEKLKPLKIHPRDALPNRYKLERAYGLYEDLIGDDRALLEHFIDRFEHVLGEQDFDQIDSVGESLERFMNQKSPAK